MNESFNAHTDVFLELPSDPGLQKVVCPPEHFISVAAPDLARALQSAPSLPFHLIMRHLPVPGQTRRAPTCSRRNALLFDAFTHTANLHKHVLPGLMLG